MKELFTVGSLFTGIGGLDLGLEQTGRFRVAWQIEINNYCQEVLARRWPHVTRFRDVRTCGSHNLIPVDVMVGGFPCQDISLSNTRNPQGINGTQSGLWSEFYRLICELRPNYIIVENVSALLHRGMGRVLGDLAYIGYDAEWQVLQASDFELPHQRKRVFIVAYSNTNGRPCFQNHHVQRSVGVHQRQASDTMVLLRDMVAQLEERWGEPSVLRTDDGLPSRMEQLEGLGNAVVPRVAQYVGECIVQHEEM